MTQNSGRRSPSVTTVVRQFAQNWHLSPKPLSAWRSQRVPDGQRCRSGAGRHCSADKSESAHRSRTPSTVRIGTPPLFLLHSPNVLPARQGSRTMSAIRLTASLPIAPTFMDVFTLPRPGSAAPSFGRRALSCAGFHARPSTAHARARRHCRAGRLCRRPKRMIADRREDAGGHGATADCVPGGLLIDRTLGQRGRRVTQAAAE
jgi:hypothetical protein